MTRAFFNLLVVLTGPPCLLFSNPLDKQPSWITISSEAPCTFGALFCSPPRVSLKPRHLLNSCFCLQNTHFVQCKWVRLIRFTPTHNNRLTSNKHVQFRKFQEIKQLITHSILRLSALNSLISGPTITEAFEFKQTVEHFTRCLATLCSIFSFAAHN